MELTWWDTQLGASLITSNGCKDIRKQQSLFILSALFINAVTFYVYKASVTNKSVSMEHWWKDYDRG
jgi:hypothetical protein